MHFLAIVVAIILIGIFWPIFLGLFTLAMGVIVIAGVGAFLYFNWDEVGPTTVMIVIGLALLSWFVNLPEKQKAVEPPKPKSKTRVDPTFDDDVVREFDLELKRRSDGTYR